MMYTVEADLYEGPLPLLVEMAKLNLIDVFLVTLAGLTKAYLEQVNAAQMDVNTLAEPLPLFGQLLAIKARGLLPQPAATEEDSEVAVSLEELERRLKEYEQFKTVAQLLAELHALQHQRFTRPNAAAEPVGPETPVAEQPFEVSLVDLMGAFSRILAKATAPVYQVTAEPWTVEMKVRELRTLLTVERRIRFLDLFTPNKSRLELVVIFLALLELIRQHVASAIQERSFDDILIAYCGPAGPPPS